MKKILIIVMSIVMVFSITACGINNKQTNDSNIEDNQENYEIYYGKISSLVGNEIELSLAKNDFIIDEESGLKPGDQEIEAATTMTSSSEAGVTSGGDQGGAEERVEMEFTGESKTFTVPAGADIFQSNSQVGKLSEVKKGSIVIIYVNKENGIVANVTIVG